MTQLFSLTMRTHPILLKSAVLTVMTTIALLTAWNRDAPSLTPKCAFRTIAKLRMCFNSSRILCKSRYTRSSPQTKCRVCTSSARRVTSHSSRSSSPACSEATPAMLIPLHRSGRPDAPQSLCSYLSSSFSNRLLNRKLLSLQFRPSRISSIIMETRSNLSTVKNLTL